jgi:hypothetical protein
MSTPNFLTILLSRSDDPGEKYPGELTVGETVPGFEAIANQPKISVTQVPNSFRSGQHWQVQLVRFQITPTTTAQANPGSASRTQMVLLGLMGRPFL